MVYILAYMCMYQYVHTSLPPPPLSLKPRCISRETHHRKFSSERCCVLSIVIRVKSTISMANAVGEAVWVSEEMGGEESKCCNKSVA